LADGFTDGLKVGFLDGAAVVAFTVVIIMGSRNMDKIIIILFGSRFYNYFILLVVAT
jgi:hypothetical protein